MLIKFIHMGAGVLVIALFLLQSYLVITKKQIPKGLKVVSHINFTLVLLLGLALLLQTPKGAYPHWLFAKIILFFVALSASLKAFKAVEEAQKKAGIFVTTLAYAGIVGLIIIQPSF